MADKEVTFYYDELLHSGTPYSDKLKGSEYSQAILIKGSGSEKLSEKEEYVVARGFINEDSLSITASNSWGKLDGVPGIGSVSSFLNKARSVGAGMSSFAEGVTGVVFNLANEYGLTKWVGEQLHIDNLEDQLAKAKGAVSEITGAINSISQNSVESADAFLRIFNGSEIEFPHQFTEYLITDSYEIGKDKGNDVHKLYLDRIKATIGNYTSDSKYGGFIGFTSPPNQFKTTLDGLTQDSHPSGTFTLAFARYFIRGLLVDSVNAEVSTTKVKVKNGESTEIRPLYIKLTYNLTPAVKYSINDLEKRFNGT